MKLSKKTILSPVKWTKTTLTAVSPKTRKVEFLVINGLYARNTLQCSRIIVSEVKSMEFAVFVFLTYLELIAERSVVDDVHSPFGGHGLLEHPGVDSTGASRSSP